MSTILEEERPTTSLNGDRVERSRGLDGNGDFALPNHSTTPLSSGQIVAWGDALSVELVEPNEHPSVIMIRWPDHATVVQPARYDAVAAEIMRLLASAVTAYNQHKARRL